LFGIILLAIVILGSTGFVIWAKTSIQVIIASRIPRMYNGSNPPWQPSNFSKGLANSPGLPGRSYEMKVFTIAPDFELADVNGNAVRLSQFKKKKNVVLVFLRGFM